MSPPVEFLNALAHALSTLRLYGSGHVAYDRAVDRARAALPPLFEERSEISFSFVDGEVVCGDDRLRELRSWRWASDLTRIGAERIEIESGVTDEEVERLLKQLHARFEEVGGVGGPERPDDMAASLPHVRIRRVRASGGASAEAGEGGRIVGLDEEEETVGWLLGRAREGERIPGAVTGAVVRSLSVALHETGGAMELLATVRDHEEYTAIHSMNVSILTMAVAQAMGLPPGAAKAFGEAALLHDVGKTRVSREILLKPGPLTEEEWEEMRRHPVEGARMLLDSDSSHTLAATVAYEHHLTRDGGGYPELRYPREPHLATRLVQVCDVYDALRSDRPFRGSWAPRRIDEHLRSLAGSTLDPSTLQVVLEMVEGADEGRGGSPRTSSGPPPADATGGGG